MNDLFTIIASREIIIYLIHIKQLRIVFGKWWYSTNAHAHEHLLKDDVHVHAHPIILYACSAHAQSVKVMELDTISS